MGGPKNLSKVLFDENDRSGFCLYLLNSNRFRREPEFARIKPRLVEKIKVFRQKIHDITRLNFILIYLTITF